jgi:cytochrome P450
MASHRTGDLVPSRPRTAYYDRESGAWILSRYPDVLAAFRESRLGPVGSRGEDQGGAARDNTGVMLQRTEVQDALSASRVGEWQIRIEALAEELLQGLPTDRPVDLVQRFARPWCLLLGLIVTGANLGDSKSLSKRAALAFAGTGVPRRSFLRRRRATAAVADLKRYFEAATMPLAQATFVAVAETLPRLLASAWLALFRHPAEVTRLRADPGLMPRAVEELLRYGGIIPRLFRKANADVDLGCVRLTVGERVTLMIASANWDPEHFPEPDRVDVSRAGTGQLSLGIGHGSCAGARLVRMALGVSVATILRTFEHIGVTGTIRWRTGLFCWPISLPVTLRR